MSDRTPSRFLGVFDRTLGNLRTLRGAWRDIAASARGVLSGAPRPELSRDDAERLMLLWASRRESTHEPADADRFRSHFARFRFPGLPVEVMGGLELNAGDGWRPVQAGRLTLVGLNGLAVPVPSIPDQIRLLESFGRDKDRHRAASLRALASSPHRGEH